MLLLHTVWVYCTSWMFVFGDFSQNSNGLILLFWQFGSYILLEHARNKQNGRFYNGNFVTEPNFTPILLSHLCFQSCIMFVTFSIRNKKDLVIEKDDLTQRLTAAIDEVKKLKKDVHDNKEELRQLNDVSSCMYLE